MAICRWVGSASEADHVRCGGHHVGRGRAWPSHAGRSGVVPSMAVPLRRQSVDFGRGGLHRLAVYRRGVSGDRRPGASGRARRRPRSEGQAAARAKTDRLDASHLRVLLEADKLPKSWIPPEHVLEIRAKVRLYMDLLEARGDWLQRIHATLFQLGAPAQPQLLGRDPDRLARLEGLQSIGSSHPLYERSRPWLEIMPRGFLGCRRAGSPSRRRPGSVANRRRSLPVLAPPAGERGVERPIGHGDLPGRDRRAPSSRSATRRSPA